MSGSVIIPNIFAAQAGPIPLSQLDVDFTTVATAVNTLANFSNYYVDSSGAPNQVVVTVPSPQVFSYAAGVSIQVKVANTTTSGTVNINVNSLGNKTIVNQDGSNPSVGQFIAGGVYDFIYDGTNFQPKGSGAGTGFFKSLNVGVPTSGVALTVNSLAANYGVSVLGTAGNVAYAGFAGNGNVIGTSDFFIGQDGSGNGVIDNRANAPINLYTNGTPRMVLSSSGNVTINSPGSGSPLTINAFSTGASIVTTDGTANAQIDFGGGGHTFELGTISAHNLAFYAGNRTFFIATPSGNATINAPSSGNSLTVNGVAGGNSLVINPASGGTSIFSNDGTTQIILQQGSGTATLGTVTAHSFGLLTTNSERLHISSIGNITINAPSSGSLPALTVTPVTNGVSLVSGLLIVEDNNGLSSGGVNLFSQGTNKFLYGTQGNAGSSWFTNGSNRIDIVPAGNVTINAPSSGQALLVNGVASSYAAAVVNAAAAGTSLGLVINAGANSSDVSFRVQERTGTTDYFFIRGDGLIQGRGSNAAALVNMSPDTGTFSASFTGFTTATNMTLTWYKIGSLVLLKGTGSNMGNTSNATTMTISNLPASITPATDTYVPCSGLEDNGVSNKNGNCLVRSINTVEFQLFNGASFTASGTKGVSGSWAICYSLQ